MSKFEKVALIGPGLIGGSLALEAKQKGLFGHVTAWSRRPETIEAAVKKGVADQAARNAAECAKGADLVVIATPVSAIEDVAKAIAPVLEPKTVITDVGSVKGYITERVTKALPYPSRFVPGHPVAGSEKFGPESAVVGLFAGKKCVLTPTGKTDKDAVWAVREIWEAVGMKVVEMAPERHDRLLAATSHLPHLVAYALVESVKRVQESESDVFNFTAGGFHDFTRIAASSPEMWRDIFMMNSGALAEMAALFEKVLDELNSVIKDRDGADLKKRLEDIRRIKEELTKLRSN